MNKHPGKKSKYKSIYISEPNMAIPGGLIQYATSVEPEEPALVPLLERRGTRSQA